MKKAFLPYYISRAILSFSFALSVMGVTWGTLLMGMVVFSLFLLYLHSGWFYVDLTYPLAPLRRDMRGMLIQRKALLFSIGASFLIYLFSSQLAAHFGLALIAGQLLVVIAILTYFVMQFVLFARA